MNSTNSVKVQVSWIHDPRLHVFMYSLLLIGTPFILLQNYLVQLVSLTSMSSFKMLGIDIKVIPMLALITVITAAIVLRKQLTRLRLAAFAVVVILDAIGQQITDYYFGHNYYDLQQNWHYIAYGIFSYIIYRDLRRHNMPLYKIMIITFVAAMGLSTFDETFQKYMSNRVFDICDIGKDVWGVLMGMILVYTWSRHSQTLFKDWKHVRHRRLRNYYRHPFTLLVMMVILAFMWLSIGSLLTESEYDIIAIIITIFCFALFLTFWHLSQFRTPRIIMLIIFTAAILTQAFFFVKYRDDNIIHTQYGLTIYKGIPIPFFDILIYQNGFFRLVDKKHYFNSRDRQFFFKRKPDILLFGSGSEGKGGQGFPDPRHVFLYNAYSQKGMQVIIQKNPEACETFNRLKKENKKVMFVIHNTC